MKKVRSLESAEWFQSIVLKCFRLGSCASRYSKLALAVLVALPETLADIRYRSQSNAQDDNVDKD